MAAVERILLQFAESSAAKIGSRVANLERRIARLKVTAAQVRLFPRAQQDIAALKRINLAIAQTNLRLTALRSRLRQVTGAQRASFRQTLQMGFAFQGVNQAISRLISTATQLTTVIIGVTVAAAKMGTEFAKTGSAVIGAEQVFRKTAIAAGETSRSLTDKLGKAAQGTISNFGLMREANFAFIAGAQLTGDQMVKLVDASVKLAAAGFQVGGSVVTAEQAFNRLTNGIIKQERRILDDLGVVVRANEVFREFAATQGIVSRQLTAQERILAFRNIVVDAAVDKSKLLSDVDIGLVGVGNKLSASFSNFTNELARMFVETGAANRLLQFFQETMSRIIEDLSQPGAAEEFFVGIVDGIARVVSLAELLFDILQAIAPVLDRIVTALTAGAIGAAIGALTGAIAGFAVGGPLGSFLGAGIGAGVGGAVFGAGGFLAGDVAAPTGEEIGGAVNRGLRPNFASRDQQLRDIERTVRNGNMIPVSPAVVV